MKILLLEEFSGVHRNLKEGLLDLGFDKVTIASTGSGWRKIQGDINLGITKSNKLKDKIERLVLPFVNISKLVDYDVVQFSGPYFFVRRDLQWLNNAFMRHLIKRNASSYLLAVGCSSFYNNNAGKLRHSPCVPCQQIDIYPNKCRFEGEKRTKWDNELARAVDGIIPMSFEYAEGYRSFPNLKKNIPLPITTSRIEYQENIVKRKIVLFHGINRIGFKGTLIIERAMKELQRKYPNDVEIVIDGKMPLKEYLELMKKVNVVIDQVNGYSYGMNAIYAMAMGKVVLSGCEKETLEEFGFQSCPVINVRASEKNIIKHIEFFIEQRKRLEDFGRASREFVEMHHDSKKVAGQYAQVWKSK